MSASVARHTPPGVRFVKAPGRDAEADDGAIAGTVADILEDVRRRGDAAVAEYATRFDGVELARFEVDDAARREALDALDGQTREDTEFAIDNVRRFAEAQLDSIRPLEFERLPGVRLGHRLIPIERVGCYVPGGRYPAPLRAGHDDRAGGGRGRR